MSADTVPLWLTTATRPGVRGFPCSRGWRQVEPGLGADQAHRVRPQQHHAGRGYLIDQRIVAAGERRRDGDHRLRAELQAQLDLPAGPRVPDEQHHQLGDLGQRLDARVPAGLGLVGRAADEVVVPPGGALLHPPHEQEAPPGGPPGGADKGNAARIEERFQPGSNSTRIAAAFCSGSDSGGHSPAEPTGNRAGAPPWRPDGRRGRFAPSQRYSHSCVPCLRSGEIKTHRGEQR